MVSYYYIVNAFKSKMDNYWKDFCYTLDPETDVRKMRRYCLSVMVSYYYIVNAFKSRMDNY